LDKKKSIRIDFMDNDYIERGTREETPEREFIKEYPNSTKILCN